MTGLYIFAMALGLSAWLPSPTAKRCDSYGFRFLHALFALVIGLYVGDVVLGISLTKLAIIYVTIAAAGGCLTLFRLRGRRIAFPVSLFHPVWILGGLTLVVAVLHGGISYLPYPGDEVASWLKLARQIFLIDAYWSDKMDYHLGGYTDGWPLFIAFANTLTGFYDEAHGAILPFLLQLGLLGMAFDTCRLAVRQAPPVGQHNDAIISWGLILSLLTVQASWVLFPTLQLIDEPLLYVLLGCFLTMALAFLLPEQEKALSLYLGIGLATAYLFKIAALAMVPAAACLWLGLLSSKRPTLARGVDIALRVFVPLLLAEVSWHVFKTGTDCTASPTALLFQATGSAYGAPGRLAPLFLAKIAEYTTSYKVLITAVSLPMLISGLWLSSTRWLVVAFAAFAAAYTTALFFAYLTCLDVVSLGGFLEFERHFRLILRGIHFLGPIVGLTVLFSHETLRARFLAILSMPLGRQAAILAILLLLTGQAYSLTVSFNDIATRSGEDPVVTATTKQMQRESTELVRILEAHHMIQPTVSLIAQNGYNMEWDLGTYFGIKSRPDGNSNFLYRIGRPYAWSTQPGMPFSTQTTDTALEAFWHSYDVVWPVRTDEWIRTVLSRLVTDPDCAAYPEKYFLIRTSDDRFECVEKTSGTAAK